MKLTGKITLLATAAVLSATAAFADASPRHGKMEPVARAAALEKAGARFDAADADSDGVLSADEARDMAHGKRGKFRDHRAKREHDGPGHRDAKRGQMRPDFEPITRSDAMTRAAERFDAADADGDGILTPAEMSEAGAKMREKIKDRIKERRAGKHHDGKDRGGRHGGASRGKVFDRLDSDGDGQISREEFRAAREARADRH